MVETRSSARKARAPGTPPESDSAVATPTGKAPRARRPGGGAEVRYGAARVAAAWMVHLYTGLGLPVNLYAVHVAMYGKRDFAMFILLNWLAIFIDATDGTLARAVDVKRVVPGYDGAGLDNIIDFITFAFSPALALCVFEIVPGVALQMLCAFMILIAAGYQFCQSSAKTDDAFVGFPSYWNILVHYIYYLDAPPALSVFLIAFCAVMSFVPVHFVYPTKTVFMRKTTLVGATIWAFLMIAPCVSPGPTADTLCALSLLYPVYYCALSVYLNRRRGSPS